MNDRGAVTVGPIVWVIIVILAIIGLFAVCSGDDDELSFPVTLVSAGSSPSAQAGPVGDGGASPRDHDRGYEEDEGWEDDNGGGYTGGHRGGDYGGGKGGDDYDGDGDGNRCRNFCVYPVQPPPGDGR